MSGKFGIKRLDHVSWAVREPDDVLPLLTDLMGMRVLSRWENAKRGWRGVSLEVPGGTAHFELLAPLGEGSFLHRFLEERGPGLHHVTFEVEDVEAAATAMRDFGIEPFGGVQASYNGSEAYIHPRDSGGVLFQLYTEEEHEHEHDPPK